MARRLFVYVSPIPVICGLMIAMIGRENHT